jgi:hypothetical protein
MGNLGVNISVMILGSICGVLNIAACWKSLSFSSGFPRSDFSLLEKKQMAICLVNSTLLLFYSCTFRDVFHLGVSPSIVLCAANLMGLGNAMSLFNPLFSALEVERNESSEGALSKFLNKHRNAIDTLETILPFLLFTILALVTFIEIYLDLFVFHAIWAALIVFACITTNYSLKKLLNKVEDSLNQIELEISGAGGANAVNTGAQLRLIKSKDLKQRLTQAFGTISTATVLNLIILILSSLIKVGPSTAFSPDGASYTVVPELMAYFTITGCLPMSLIMCSTQFVHKAQVQAVQNQASGGSHEIPKGSSANKASTDGPRLPSAVEAPHSREEAPTASIEAV